MIRRVVGLAFLRWGIPGAAVALLSIVGVIWWVLTLVPWLVGGTFIVLFAFAGLGYLILLIQFIRWLRGRTQSEHLMGYGRRRWP